jgi:methionine synthase II (cobalamin-independent)
MSDKTPDFTPSGLGLLIGSLPVNDYGQALDLIRQYTPEIPLWPQLPSNPLERMLNQFIEGLPGIVETDDRTYFDLETSDFEAEQLKFYEEYLTVAEDLAKTIKSRFIVSDSRAHGIYALHDSGTTMIVCECQSETGLTAVKGQVTGPFTLLTGLSDAQHRLGYYNETFRDMAVKCLAMKAAWQVKFLQDFNVPVIVFIDEPALAGLGSSAFISIAKDDIAADLSEVIGSIQQAGGLAGIHVCANTDWPFLLSVGLDILSFDAYGFFDRLAACQDDVYTFLDKGGIIAWGLIPTADDKLIAAETATSLAARWEDNIDQLVNDKWDKKAIFKRSLITPSCGTGALSLDAATKVLELTSEVSTILRAKYLS